MHRKIMDSSIWTDSKKLKLWMLCLMKASHKEHEVLVGNQVVKLQPGEFVTGRDALADEFNKGTKKDEQVTARGLWKWIKLFEKLQMCSIKSTTKYSVITIVNWTEHQDVFQHGSNNVPTRFQQCSTNKNDKNYKKEEEAEEPPRSQDNEPSIIPIISQVDIDVIANKFITLRGKGFYLYPKDYQAIKEVLEAQVPIDDILKYLEERFQTYEPRHTRDYISSFAYCARYILDQHAINQEKNSPFPITKGTKRVGKQKSNMDILNELAKKNGLM